LNLLVLILLSVFIYLLVLFILNGIDDDELNILKQLLKG